MPHAAPSSHDAARSLLERHPHHIIFKHSPYCGRSVSAEAQVQRYLSRPDALPVTTVHVFDQRALSDALEEVTGVQHESPQALLVRDGVVYWHASHRRVTDDALVSAVAEHA